MSHINVDAINFTNKIVAPAVLVANRASSAVRRTRAMSLSSWEPTRYVINWRSSCCELTYAVKCSKQQRRFASSLGPFGVLNDAACLISALGGSTRGKLQVGRRSVEPGPITPDCKRREDHCVAHRCAFETA